MKAIEVLKLSTKIGVGIGVGTVACITTLKCCTRLCDVCSNACKKLQGEIVKNKADDLHIFGEEDKEQENENPDDTDEDQYDSDDPETRYEHTMNKFNDMFDDDEA